MYSVNGKSWQTFVESVDWGVMFDRRLCFYLHIATCNTLKMFEFVKKTSDFKLSSSF